MAIDEKRTEREGDHWPPHMAALASDDSSPVPPPPPSFPKPHWQELAGKLVIRHDDV